jgi:dTDP-4-amino-4,6-dideoxygalactose transaminase
VHFIPIHYPFTTKTLKGSSRGFPNTMLFAGLLSLPLFPMTDDDVARVSEAVEEIVSHRC